MVKVSYGTMKFLVIDVLENNTDSLKIMRRSKVKFSKAPHEGLLFQVLYYTFPKVCEHIFLHFSKGDLTARS